MKPACNFKRVLTYRTIFGVILPACVIGFGAYCFAAVLLAAHAKANDINCVENLKTLGVALREYVADRDERYPGTGQWCDDLLRWVADNRARRFARADDEGSQYLMTNLAPAVFHCPASRKKLACGYALNQGLAGWREREVPTDTVMLFESNLGWNATGGLEIAAMHHGKAFIHVVLADGLVQTVRFDELRQLRWNPVTNAATGIVR